MDRFKMFIFVLSLLGTAACTNKFTPAQVTQTTEAGSSIPSPNPLPSPKPSPAPSPGPSPAPSPGPSPSPSPAPTSEIIPCGGTSDNYDYFNLLTSQSSCLTSMHLRSQANIDLIPSRSENDQKIPIRYDSIHDGANFEIDPSGSLPHSGSTGAPQKRIPLDMQGATSMLLTWDLKIHESMQWKPDTEERVIDGETVRVEYLDQHKSHRLDDRSASPWLGMKQGYQKAGNRGLGIAQFFFSAQPQYMGPGTTRGASEIINPVLGEFYVQANTWTRVWVFIEGNIGTGDNAVRLSVWLADENRAPVRLYDRVNMIAPPGGIALFRYEFDSSLKVALNGPGQQYQRNFVVLKGLSEAQVLGFLQKP